MDDWFHFANCLERRASLSKLIEVKSIFSLWRHYLLCIRFKSEQFQKEFISMRGGDLFTSSWRKFSILELALNAVLSFWIKDITADLSDTVERMFIVLLVRIVQLPLHGTIFVNDISKIFIQREPNGKQRKVSTTFTDFMVLRILLPSNSYFF